jgi:hypothetical protein
MDIPKNVLKTLEPDEAFLVDDVVRKAVREIRRSGKQLGDLLKVEVVIGAGVKGERCMVRFFAISSTDGSNRCQVGGWMFTNQGAFVREI